MTDAWGGAWGSAWGNSWGAEGAVVVPRNRDDAGRPRPQNKTFYIDPATVAETKPKRRTRRPGIIEPAVPFAPIILPSALLPGAIPPSNAPGVGADLQGLSLLAGMQRKAHDDAARQAALQQEEEAIVLLLAAA